MKLQKAFFGVVALVFLVSLSATISGATQGINNKAQVVGTSIPSGNSGGGHIFQNGIVLVNSDTDQDLFTIENGQTIDIAEIGTENITLRYPDASPLPGSIVFKVNGSRVGVENLFPFTLPGGSNNDDYKPWNYDLNTDYVVEATEYSRSGGTGNVLRMITTNFTVIDSSREDGFIGDPRSLDSGLPSLGCIEVPAVYQSWVPANQNVFVQWNSPEGYTNVGYSSKFWVYNQNGTQIMTGTTPAYGPIGGFQGVLGAGTYTIELAFFNGTDWGPVSTLNNVVIPSDGSHPNPVNSCDTTSETTSSIKVFLGGAYNTATGKMNALLTLPTTEPYTALGYNYVNYAGGTTVSQTDLNGDGADTKIVDYVVVEIRDGANNTVVVASKPALLRANGEVMSLDNHTPILNTFGSNQGSYYIAIKHRNHLGVMTQNPYNISTNNVVVLDMTLPSLALYDKTGDAVTPTKIVNGVRVMWPGDTNGLLNGSCGIVKYTGINNDRDSILTRLNGLASSTLNGYFREDVNMNGSVKYSGSNNDRDIILSVVGPTNPNSSAPSQLPGTCVDDVTAPVAPSAPYTIIYRSNTEAKIQLTGPFTDPEDTNGLVYEVSRNNGSTWSPATFNNNQIVDSGNGYSSSSDYTYKVRAVNDAGLSTEISAGQIAHLSTEFSLNQQVQTTEEILSNQTSKLQTGGGLPGAQFSQQTPTGTQGLINGATPVYYRETGSNPYAKTFWQVDSEDIDVPGGSQVWIAEDVLDGATPPPPPSTTFPPIPQAVSVACTPGALPNGSSDSNYGNLAGGSVLMWSGYNTTNLNSPSITICWAGVSGRTTNSGKIERREVDSLTLNSSSWTTLSSTLNLSTNSSYVDNNVSVNKTYEYRISSGSPVVVSSTGYISGYLATGIESTLSEYNGEIVLVFANDIANGTDGQAPTSFGTGLQNPINQLIADLEGDRWTVDYVYVTKNLTGADTPVSTRNKILARSGTNTKAVYLIGNVPVPFTPSNPDGHGTRLFPSDIVYSDINQTLNTQGVNGCSTTSTYSGFQASFNSIYSNLPNATTYRFCNLSSIVPELQVGRIDTFDLPAFTSNNEQSLLQSYLNKVHNMKIGNTTIPDKFYYENGIGNNHDSLSNRDGWNDITSLSNDWTNNEYSTAPITNNIDYGFVYHASNAGNCSARGDVTVGSGSAEIDISTSAKWPGVFTLTGMSYMGNWACTNNVMRGMLADPDGMGVTVSYILTRDIYWHTMGMGRTIGEVFFKNMVSGATNSTSSLYLPIKWGNNGGWNMSVNNDTSLLGDPTMRASYIKQPGAVTITGQQISWSASQQSGGVDGYLVYKITSNNIQRVSDLVSGTSWTYTGTVSSGDRFMVTAVKKKTSVGGGVYWNESIGKISVAQSGGGGDTQAPSAPAGLTSTSQTTSSINLSWNASTGNPVGESIIYKIYRSSSSNGTYSQVGTSTTTSYQDTGLSSGTTYYYKIAASDVSGNTSSQTPTTGYAIATLTPPDTQAPNNVTGLTVGNATATNLGLSWNASTDNGGGTVAGYKIYRSLSQSSGYSFVSQVSGVSYTDSGLLSSTTYWYKVTAIDNSNNESSTSSAMTASGQTTAQPTGGSGQVLGLTGYAGPNNTEDVTVTANPYGVVDYFVDSVAGNDSNNGTSVNTPWKTISKLNSSGINNLQPGSRVFFKRGGVYRGTGAADLNWEATLGTWKSGTATRPIEYRAYGQGNAPIISGSVDVGGSGWSTYSGNIYVKNIGANLPVKYLFIGEQAQTMARTPNKVNGNTTWFTTDAQVGLSDGFSITDSELPTPTQNNLVGAKVIKRYTNFNYAYGTITSHVLSGSTKKIDVSAPGADQSYDGNSIYPGAGWGYLIEGDLELLDQPGEWYYNPSNGNLYLWASSGVNPNQISVDAVVDTHIVGNTDNSYINFKNLVFEKTTLDVIELGSYTGHTTRNIGFYNNEIRFGFRGMNISTTGTSTEGNIFSNNYIHDIYNTGIKIYSDNGSINTLQGNVIENIGMDIPMGIDGSLWMYQGIRIMSGTSKTNLVNNIIRNIGYIGVGSKGSGQITGNLIENTSAKLNDGCSICIDSAQSDLLISRNVIKNIFGNIENVPPPPQFVHGEPISGGISSGDQSNDAPIIEENVVTEFGNSGIAVDNNYFSNNIRVRNNTVFTDLPGNTYGASGIKLMDQSVHVAAPGGGYPCSSANYGCFVANFNHKIYNNDVYMLDQNNHALTLHFQNNTNVGPPSQNSDFGDFYGNYFLHAKRSDSVMLKRLTGYNTGTYNYTVAQFQTNLNEPPAGQAQNIPSGYTIANQSDMPKIYVNETTSPQTYSPGAGWCNKNKQTVSSIVLNQFADVSVVQKCSLMP